MRSVRSGTVVFFQASLLPMPDPTSTYTPIFFNAALRLSCVVRICDPGGNHR